MNKNKVVLTFFYFLTKLILTSSQHSTTKYTLLPYVYYNIALCIVTCFVPHGIFIREPISNNIAKYEISNFYT